MTNIRNANSNNCCGLSVNVNGSWASGADNGFQRGNESPESYTCFIEFLDDNGVPSCNSLTNPISTEKGTPFFENDLETN